MDKVFNRIYINKLIPNIIINNKEGNYYEGYIF